MFGDIGQKSVKEGCLLVRLPEHKDVILDPSRLAVLGEHTVTLDEAVGAVLDMSRRDPP